MQAGTFTRRAILVPPQSDRSSTNTGDKKKPFHPAWATACPQAPHDKHLELRTLRCTVQQWPTWHLHTHFIWQPGETDLSFSDKDTSPERSQSKLVTQSNLNPDVSALISQWLFPVLKLPYYQNSRDQSHQVSTKPSLRTHSTVTRKWEQPHQPCPSKLQEIPVCNKHTT